MDAARFLELLPHLGHLLEPQVRGADVIVLNKLDGCPALIQQETRRRLRELNAVAPLVGTTYARVDLQAMDGWSAAGGGSAAEAGGHAAAHGVAAWAFTEPGVFAEEALQALLASLPESLLRLKGFVALPTGAHFLNAVPGDWQLEPLAGDRPTALVCIGPPGTQERLTAALRRCIINPS